MANGTWQEAIACPRCGFTGDEAVREMKTVTPAEGVTRGGKTHVFYCRNSRCRWYNTSWTVQVNPDGTIPDPKQYRPKQFTDRYDPALAAQIRANLERLQSLTTVEGSEVRR